jgi:hypothetical protein
MLQHSKTSLHCGNISTVKMDIPPPQVLKQPLKVPQKTLMGPGPSNCSPRVMNAISQPILGHMHPEIFKVSRRTPTSRTEP